MNGEGSAVRSAIRAVKMCFSATASFVTAGATAAIGLASVSKVHEARELPLAATPLLFALQQSIEGLLWLDLPLAPEGSTSTGLTLLFLFFAEAFWPAYIPIAVFLIEPVEWRRRLMLLAVAAGAGLSGYLLWSILDRSLGAVIAEDHIVYVTKYPHSQVIALAYFAAAGLPPLLSSHRTVNAFGAIVIVGAAIAYVSYWEAFISVWCFFAAAASVVIMGHFAWSRRLRMAGV